MSAVSFHGSEVSQHWSEKIPFWFELWKIKVLIKTMFEINLKNKFKKFLKKNLKNLKKNLKNLKKNLKNFKKNLKNFKKKLKKN